MDFTTLSLADLIAVDFSEFDAEKLAAYKAELASRFAASKEALTGQTPTRAQRDEVLSIRTRHGEVATRETELAAEEPVTDEEAADLEALSLDDDEDAEDEGAEGDEGADDGDEGAEGDESGGAEDEGAEGAEDAEDASAQATATKKVAAAKVTQRPTKATARIALAGKRPEIPVVNLNEQMLSITAAADTGLPTGSAVSLEDLDKAWFDRSSRFPRPQGDGKTEDIRTFGLAQIVYDQTPEFAIDETMSTSAIHQVFEKAVDEHRLDGGSLRGESLTASAGWCAPSEIMYNLPGQEVIDGMYSAPEVQVNRGGFKHTTGISWATLIAGVGFTQTETQAIAGTSKASYEVPCPTFTEARLDAIGVNLRIPILLETGYPELVSNVTSRALQVHQVRMNAYKLAAVATLGGAARDYSDVDKGSTVVDTLTAVNLVLSQLRQKYRLGSDATLEVLFPVWAEEVFREDLSTRTFRPVGAVQDSEIMAHFAARQAAVQFVYDWSDLPNATDHDWPTTIPFMVYPAGTVIVGAANVINLSSIYDAASLATNIYTGLFAEQGILVEKMNYEVIKGSVPVCNAGRTGAANLTCS